MRMGLSCGTKAIIPPGVIKINCDGAVFEQGNEMGVGIIARNEAGVCVAWSSNRIPKPGEGELAEAPAVRHGLEVALQYGWPSIIIESDCANLVSKLKSLQSGFLIVGPIVSDSLYFASKFRPCSFCYVSRLCNAVAHALAKSAIASLDGSSNMPAWIANLVLADISTL
ncbi:UNVERIFIED_CONTAM: hypothetical protein Slati_2647500 [Sesamum latifolium]|uniref:RNase H type-1 domain-containing protein n=1 Tax=Sesamum latifolium TaxID=2727402 RepID=A0AAW2VUY6_9LAMI